MSRSGYDGAFEGCRGGVGVVGADVTTNVDMGMVVLGVIETLMRQLLFGLMSLCGMKIIKPLLNVIERLLKLHVDVAVWCGINIFDNLIKIEFVGSARYQVASDNFFFKQLDNYLCL